MVKSSKRDKTLYYNIPCAFDIETTSFYKDREKQAIMYIWQLGINGYVFIGRTWEEFKDILQTISYILELNSNKRLVIYVHNLSYEFQFMRKWFNWTNVFAVDSRKVVYAVSDLGIEFRCSYILTGKSLAKVGDDLNTYKVNKLVGDLDYSLIRNANTKLSEQELSYCINDVKVVMALIKEKIESDGDITKIPLTKTSYVRSYCKNACLYAEETSHKKAGKIYSEYTKLMKNLVIDGENEYNQLKRAFMGGFTHANPFYVGKTIENVKSYDFTSSYPFTMVAFRGFPMSSSEIVKPRNAEEFERNIKYYCCLFDVEFINIESKDYFEHYIPHSKCWNVEQPIISNGRIVSAKRLCITITEQDYEIIKQVYTWDKIKLGTFRRYKRGYLPTNFVKSILKLYKDKTMLKGVEDREVDYNLSKELLNSCYGMAVTDICQPEQIYDNDSGWSVGEVDYNELINKYNNKFQRFLFYPWGLWVTAISRRNLWTGILEFKHDYIYSDTDSIKVINYDKHQKYFEKYNNNCIQLLKESMKYHGLAIEMCIPKTIKGIEKPLGVWDDEGVYSRFKTLRAKCYMTEKNNKINITVSGLNKKVTVPYLLEKSENPFDIFTNNLYVPEYATGKNTHTYIDEEICGELTDYQGNKAKYHEYSYIHMEGADYSLSLTDAFIEYISGIQEKYK